MASTDLVTTIHLFLGLLHEVIFTVFVCVAFVTTEEWVGTMFCTTTLQDGEEINTLITINICDVHSVELVTSGLDSYGLGG